MRTPISIIVLASLVALFNGCTPGNETPSEDAGTEPAGMEPAGKEPAKDNSVAGFSVMNMDLTTDPGDDFARYATGGWIDRTEIPDDKIQVRDSNTLLDALDEALLEIAQESAAATGAKKTGNVQLVGDFYTAALDTARHEALGLKPIEPLLAAAASAESPKQFAELAAQLEKALGANPFLGTSVGPDSKQRNAHALYIGSDVGALGFGLNRNEYVNPDSQKIRDDYTDLIANLLKLAGDDPDTAKNAADAALAFEKEVAEGTMTPAQAADPNATYNALTPAELKKLLPAVDLDSYFAALGVSLPESVVLNDPGAMKSMQAAVSSRSSDELSSLIRAYIVRKSAGLLGGEYYATIREYQKVKSGLPKLPSREKETTDGMSFLMAHPYSQLYVEEYFNPERRQAVVDMMDSIKHEFEQRIEANEWLSDSTKATALAKLDKIRVFVGHPARAEDWIDYSGVRIAPDDFFGNVVRLREFDKQRNLDLLDKPVEVDQFTVPGKITPISMNAAVHQGFLVVYVTAAFIQPPYYVESNDAAANFGSLGAVVGHELTHAFDSKGRNYDVNGELHDWWAPQDAEEFEKRANVLVEQYNNYEVAPGVKVNGELTLSENIADLGGLTLAYNALQTYMKENGRLPDQDGLTPEQRFFVAWAQVWMAKTRIEGLKVLVATDAHSPSEVRSFGPAVNMDVFYDTFGIEAGDPMWKDPADRVTIW